MWKKDEEQSRQSPTPSTRVAQPATGTPRVQKGQATIGPSISIQGDVTGSEDLVIEGEVTGSVTLDDHAVGVGRAGRVSADIVGRIITVEGRVEGDLTAQEQIVLRDGANVKGDIKAPRVVLEDGATFRGLVDMGGAPGSDDAKTSKADTTKSDAAGAGRDTKDASTAGKSDGSGDSAKDTAESSSKAASGPTSGSPKQSGADRKSARA